MNAIRDALVHRNTKDLCARLTDINEIKKAASEVEFLVTWRLAKGNKAWQEIRLESDVAGLERLLEQRDQFGFVVVPIGRLLRELADRISASSGG